jgi:hypothetical protein
MVSIAINHQTRFGTILVACHSPLSANILSSSSLLSFADLLRSDLETEGSTSKASSVSRARNQRGESTLDPQNG